MVECVYNTEDRNATTFSGIATHDEMCLVYADYYPSVYDGFVCISSPDPIQFFNALGEFDPAK